VAGRRGGPIRRRGQVAVVAGAGMAALPGVRLGASGTYGWRSRAFARLAMCACTGALALGLALTLTTRSPDSITRAHVAPPVTVRGPASLAVRLSEAVGVTDPDFWVTGDRAAFGARGSGIAGAFGRSGAIFRMAGGTVTFGVASLDDGSTQPRHPRVAQEVQRNTVTFTAAGLTEWYRNGPLGVEQGFTVRRLPHVGSQITLVARLGGSLTPRLDGGSLLLDNRAGRAVLAYGGLSATDASGRALFSSLRLRGGHLLLRVDTVGARLPITIDPLIVQAEGLSVSDESPQAEFGSRVAISADGNTALIGGDYDGYGIGATWVFTRSGSAWTEQAKLTASDETGYGDFGCSVSLSADGTIALIGGFNDAGPADTSPGIGAAWVFTRSGSKWTQDGSKLEPSDAVSASHFGQSVSISGDGSTALIGGPWDSGGVGSYPGLGSAWVFTRSGSTWTQQGSKLQPSDGETQDGFGASTALSANGDVALIGSLVHQAGAQIGGMWFFTRSGSAWSQAQGRLHTGASDGVLSADGDTALLQTTSGAMVVTRSGSTWTYPGTVLYGPADANGDPYTPGAVGLSPDGDTALVEIGYNPSIPLGALEFQLSGGSWVQQSPGLAPPVLGSQGDWGSSVALSTDGSTVLIGGPLLGDSLGGEVQVYVASPTSVTGLSPMLGLAAGGRAVTITGTGLADVTAVDFGSTPAASFSVVSATQIDAVAPANAVGTVDVTVAVAGGTSSLSPNDKFIYDTVPGPQNPVTAVAGNGEAFVSPASDGDGLVPITSYTVTASPGDEQASGATTPITVPGLTNGTSYTFTVTATNALGTGPPSNPSNAVTPFGPPTSLTQPALSTSTPEIDDTIATTTGSWTFSPTSYRYQWLACAAGGGCTPIPGATGGSYTIRPADTGMELAVDVTATNSMGQSAPAESERTTVVVARPGVPVNLTPPAISGDPAAGSTLTASDGTWSKAPTTVTIQFLDCSQPGLGCHDDGQPFEESISDPASLALSNTDAADYTEALVFATNAVGDSAAVTTNTLGPVIAAPGTITITAPSILASYPQNSVVDASYSCALPTFAGVIDLPPWGTAWLSSCSGTVANGAPIDTSTPGQHSFTVTAVDRDGGTATKAISYSVTAATAPPAATVTPPAMTEVPPRPPGIDKVTVKSTTATFRFTRPASGAHLECALVRRVTGRHAKEPRPIYTTCGLTKTYRGLRKGNYTLWVRSVTSDATDSTPVQRSFKIA